MYTYIHIYTHFTIHGYITFACVTLQYKIVLKKVKLHLIKFCAFKRIKSYNNKPEPE